MSKRLTFTAIAILSSLLAASCGDDPELVRKRDQQRAEIRKLEGELSILKEQLKDAPKDRSAELKELQGKVKSEREQIATLEKEVADLESQRRKLDREFEDYRQTYPVR
ncbi:hypothetical protein [Haloferula sp.]|uniref:hypothetical protein n=1 Tax=Haloferula sp. TaxID=2497595 RepID=UPI00329CEE6C